MPATVSESRTLFPALARPAVTGLSTSLIRKLANTAMDLEGLLPFWFGETDQVTPEFIRQAAIGSLQRGETFYAQNLGRPYLRTALSTYLTDLHGRPIAAEQIAVVTAGISGLMLIAQSILSAGDRVVAMAPIWSNVTEIPTLLGAHVARVPLSVTDGRWSLDTDAMLAALTPDTRMLIINSPGNPTGWTMEEEQVDIILNHCRRHGIWILTDDVYQRLGYDLHSRCAPSFLSRYEDGDRIISANSFSKSWIMTGFRVGWIVAPPSLIDEMSKLIEYNTCCVFEPAQRAAEAALLHGEPTIRKLREDLIRGRAIVADGLRQLPGIEVPETGGAMYTFFKIDGYPDTLKLTNRLVHEARLGLAPGAAFGPEGQGWLRWCHAVSDAKLKDGISRLAGFLKSEGR